MLDFSNLPPKYKSTVQIFTATGSTNLTGFQEWIKPRGVSMVSIICVAGGGGGGGGFTRTAGAAGGGGGGGACSGLSRFECPAILLPDVMYIQVGAGGMGGVASGAGAAGLNSYVLTSKTAVSPNMITYSGANAPGGGGGGTGAGAGTAGTVPTIAALQTANAWGQWSTIVGIIGALGGAQTGAVGVTVSAWSGIPLSPGAGGAGCTATDFAGGAQNATALLDIGSQGYYLSSAGGIAPGGTAAGVGVDGSSGVMRITPFFNSGGAGGGSNNSGQAGNGGNGGYGCGGGGGGAGATGGRGGNGGNGIVIITAW